MTPPELQLWCFKSCSCFVRWCCLRTCRVSKPEWTSIIASVVLRSVASTIVVSDTPSQLWETIIRIFCLRKQSIFNKRKNGKKRIRDFQVLKYIVFKISVTKFIFYRLSLSSIINNESGHVPVLQHLLYKMNYVHIFLEHKNVIFI